MNTLPTTTTTPAGVPSQRAPRNRAWKILAVVAGALAFTAGLILEYVPFYGGGHTIPQANAVCSGFGGLFIQGLAKAFGTARQGAEVASSCSVATTAEHFIGPLIIGGLLLLAAGIVLIVRDSSRTAK